MNRKVSGLQSRAPFRTWDNIYLETFRKLSPDWKLPSNRHWYAKFTALFTNRLAIQTCSKLQGNKPGHMNKLTSLLSFFPFWVSLFKLTGPFNLIFPIAANIRLSGKLTFNNWDPIFGVQCLSVWTSRFPSNALEISSSFFQSWPFSAQNDGEIFLSTQRIFSGIATKDVASRCKHKSNILTEVSCKRHTRNCELKNWFSRKENFDIVDFREKSLTSNCALQVTGQ